MKPGNDGQTPPASDTDITVTGDGVRPCAHHDMTMVSGRKLFFGKLGVKIIISIPINILYQEQR